MDAEAFIDALAEDTDAHDAVTSLSEYIQGNAKALVRFAARLHTLNVVLAEVQGDSEDVIKRGHAATLMALSVLFPGEVEGLEEELSALWADTISDHAEEVAVHLDAIYDTADPSEVDEEELLDPQVARKVADAFDLE